MKLRDLSSGLILTGAALLVGGPVAPTPAFASPIGIAYEVTFDANVTGSGPVFGTEGHLRTDVPFDGLPDGLPNDLIPAPPLLPGNPLWVTESVTDLGGGIERIEILVFGEDASDPATPPAAGSFGPLFVNPLTSGGFSALTIDGLYWANMPGSAPDDIQDRDLFASYDAGTTETLLTFGTDFFVTLFPGPGTQALPLGFQVRFEPAALAGAESVRLTLDVRHVPESGTCALAALGLLAVRLRNGGRNR